MIVRYVGPSGTGVTVPHADPEHPGATTSTVCPPGVPVDLPDPVAAELVYAGVFDHAPADGETATTTTQNEEG